MGLFNIKKEMVQINFGVPYFDVYDPRFPDFGVPLAVRGVLYFQINNYKKFTARYGLSVETFQEKIRNSVIAYVKEYVANAPIKYSIPVVQLEQKTRLLTKIIQSDLNAQIKRNFKIDLSIDITNIEIDKTSDEYARLKEITMDVTTSTILAQTEVSIQKMKTEEIANAKNYEELLHIEREKERKSNYFSAIKIFCMLLGLAIIILLIFLLLNK